MTLQELEKIMIERGWPKAAYSLTGGLPNEACCIEHGPDGGWRTYYSERGVRSDLQEFDTESEACDYFFKFFINGETPPTYRIV